MGTPHVKARGQIILSVSGRRLAWEPGEDAELRERRRPGHAEECGAPAESLAHQHTEAHTNDDRQGESVCDHRQGAAMPLGSAQSGGIPAGGRHEGCGGQREEQARGQERCIICRQRGEQIGEHESAHGDGQQTTSSHAGGCGVRQYTGRFPITVQ